MSAGWVQLQREAGEEPETNETAALELLVSELGLTPAVVDEQAEFIRSWNDDVYGRARELREADKGKGAR